MIQLLTDCHLDVVPGSRATVKYCGAFLAAILCTVCVQEGGFEGPENGCGGHAGALLAFHLGGDVAWKTR